ncbi:MAG TPA: hypothetical protein DCS07_18255 [Bdellovibrionales bacterium]|nr:MAG: hypothetical protein A2Z97_00280 [Bdellovibrionales bacterium GWB1_52_6]OFZ04183.1 MAG: hypothetical protein A2X97_15425 [Bdellovibrionales bacterium GWA1_52_35]OFZ32350.1 MAG: hypothetical protein A2070_03465 [Bdellovibrionales bacterium GWC1_52_8]HAR44546.1 hypothetical protein [Bdellovibrionales bacterium]HCM40527.1 hypothetical protein [Bdellovibrionales bacterium]
MPVQVFLGAAVEFFLILFSCIFLLKPRLLFGEWSEKAGSALTFLGMFFVCLCFCWSVILGGVLFVNGYIV